MLHSTCNPIGGTRLVNSPSKQVSGPSSSYGVRLSIPTRECDIPTSIEFVNIAAVGEHRQWLAVGLQYFSPMQISLMRIDEMQLAPNAQPFKTTFTGPTAAAEWKAVAALPERADPRQTNVSGESIPSGEGSLVDLLILLNE